jgi:chromosome segregation protein
MPVGFSRIRIAGFKSFAEPEAVEILPGLTGIVGPNGCGKSNVVEALRWAMGESSARSLRGGEMDDVIFAGTAHRPARNLAEVVLTLEAASASFPPPFDQQAELEVSRRIERGSGSTYRVNGKEARARDVQTLFADLASGARASAMVSQGRVGALVQARPEERRALLEEASGIGGLSSRRHEAELKLRQAEVNAERSEALRAQLSAQLVGLQKQARQAARYRSLSGLIRAAEAEYLAVALARAAATRAACHAVLTERRNAMEVATVAAQQAVAEATRVAESLPALRQAESEARTALERARIEAERAGAEQEAASANLAAAREATARISRDRDHAAQLQRDAHAAEGRLAEEAAQLAEALESLPAKLRLARDALGGAEQALREADAVMHAATAEQAALAARAQSVIEARQRAEARLAQLRMVLDGLSREHSSIVPVDSASLAASAAAVSAAEAAYTASATALEQAEQLRIKAAAAHQAALARLNDAEPRRARLVAEAEALDEILSVHGDADRLIDALTVPPGLEAAIAAALGDILELPTDQAAPRHMRVLPELAGPALPDGAESLAGLVPVGVPPALGRALSRVGVYEDEAGADSAHATLLPGQVLVSRAGEVWRWDGFYQRAGAPSPAAIRLQQRNRLAALRAEVEASTAARDAALVAVEAAAAAERDCVAAEARARAAQKDVAAGWDRARRDEADLQRRATLAAARLAALEAQQARLQAEIEVAGAEARTASQRCAAQPDPDLTLQAVAKARAALTAARQRETEARGAVDALARQEAARRARLHALTIDLAAWRERAASAATRIADLADRAEEADRYEQALACLPDLMVSRREEAAAALDGAERRHRAVAATLRNAEAQALEAGKTDRAAQSALAAFRESVLRAEADAREADHDWGHATERRLEKNLTDADLAAPDDWSLEAEDRARRKAERLAREREEMGPVNLRAEIEAAELEQRLDAIDRDRAELTASIHKLRGSIGHLNREGRERLTQVFTEVDRNFQYLFARMFGGGRAHLALVGSDDPLEAGLEIYAQPPGKKLATLSLLSGGEQALTALSLIFAVFRCNPAPVCVLDEVDAPLDDANIVRFCALLADMVSDTGTRFLVVTHHHMTMARMDRLYGVTMQERGVSRLLSVDLSRATELVEPLAAAE